MLNHVMVWKRDHWEKIEAGEASKLYGGATVSYKQKIFYCEVCSQYVTLTQVTDRRFPYFKHSTSDQNKDCEDRSKNYEQTYNFKKNSHSLPLKLDIKEGTVYFLLGFPPIPLDEVKNIRFFKVKVTNSLTGDSFIFNSERFDLSKTTYLNVGQSLLDKYEVEVLSDSPVLKERWQLHDTFYAQKFTLFDGATGKKLPRDADVEIDHPYYLVVNRATLQIAKDIECKKLHVISSNGLRLYQLWTRKFTEASSRFFIEIGYRLTKYPAKLYPVWPVFVEQPYNILYFGKKIGFFVSGNVRLYDVNLSTNNSRRYDDGTNKGSLVQISSGKGEHLAYIGRNNVLRYTYFRESTLSHLESEEVNVSVTDDLQKPILEGIYDKVPHNKKLNVLITFDGVVKRIKGKKKIYIHLKADEPKEIGNINLGERIAVYVGNDCLYTIAFVLPDHNDDEMLYRELIACQDQMIALPHKFLAIVHYFEDYPKVKKYLQLCLKRRTISLNAMRKLSKVIRFGGM